MKSTSSKNAFKLSSSAIEKKIKIAKKYGLTKKDLMEMLRTAYISRKVDDAEISMKKQSKAYFQISGAGHEGILSAAAKPMRNQSAWNMPITSERLNHLPITCHSYPGLGIMKASGSGFKKKIIGP